MSEETRDYSLEFIDRYYELCEKHGITLLMALDKNDQAFLDDYHALCEDLHMRLS